MSPKKNLRNALMLSLERINIFFTPEQLDKIKEQAGKLGISVSAYIRMIVLKEVSGGET